MILAKCEGLLKENFNSGLRLSRFGPKPSQIQGMFCEYFYSQINDFWFKQEAFEEDRTFRLSCEVLRFMDLRDLTQLPNSQKIQRNLTGSIELLKELDYSFALEYKFAVIYKVLENISFLVHYVNDTARLPGNEVILWVFIWCVIQSQNFSMKSTFKYLELFVEDEQKVGELGFAMTQLEATILFIGKSPITKSEKRLSS